MGAACIYYTARPTPRTLTLYAPPPLPPAAAPQITTIETEISFGQVEQLIEAAKSELELIPMYASWKMWEEKMPAPNDKYFESIYEELEKLDGKLEWHSGVKQLEERKRVREAAEKKLT